MGDKPTVCAYTSIFTLIYLVKAVNTGASINSYATDYCAHIESNVGSKIKLISQLSQYGASHECMFEDACLKLFSDVPNQWMDPVIPSEIITYGDMC